MAYAATQKLYNFFYNLLSTFAQHFTWSLQSASYIEIQCEMMNDCIQIRNAHWVHEKWFNGRRYLIFTRGAKSGKATPRSMHENFDARPGNQNELWNQAGVKLLNIVVSTSLFSHTTSLLLFNEAEINNMLNQQCQAI